MYERLCGEGNITRKEFYYELTFHEANILVRGLDNRYRAVYNANRFVANVVAQVLTGKSTELKFPWDPHEEDDYTDEEIKELLGIKNNK